ITIDFQMKPLLIFVLLSCVYLTSSKSTSLRVRPEPESVPSLPHISRSEKWRMIRESGQDPTQRRRASKGERTERARRLAPWRRTRPLDANLPRPLRPPRALSIGHCPKKFDAVTRASNGRTYLFAGDRVYQSWMEDGLNQKASFSIVEMFSGGPSRVSAVSTNSRSGVTTLYYGRNSYRFRWNEDAHRFHIARNSPKQLNNNITVTPSSAFEWDGHQVLLDGPVFITYDAYWNIETFKSETLTYFPGIPRDVVGVILDKGNTVFFYTKRNTIQVYDRVKHKMSAEFPIGVSDYAGCFV
ncbi:hypothetical protein PMAYCL1PPCAC_29419, partial [Pristionchus mayeri]